MYTRGRPGQCIQEVGLVSVHKRQAWSVYTRGRPGQCTQEAGFMAAFKGVRRGIPLPRRALAPHRLFFREFINIKYGIMLHN